MFRRPFAGVLRNRLQSSTEHPSLAPNFIHDYLRHVYPVAGQEVPELVDILPAPSENLEIAYKFQHLVTEKLRTSSSTAAAAPPQSTAAASASASGRQQQQQTGVVGSVVGWRVGLQSDVLLKNLRASEDVVSTLISPWCYHSGATIDRQKQRVQAVDLTLLFEIGVNSIDDFVREAAAFTGNTKEGAAASPRAGAGAHLLGLPPVITAVYPALELTGSRFPFYTPHLAAFVADMACTSGMVIGPRIPVTAAANTTAAAAQQNQQQNQNQKNPVVDFSAINFAEHGAVITRDASPVAVGYGKLCHQHPVTASANCLKIVKREFGGGGGGGAAQRGRSPAVSGGNVRGKLVSSGAWCRVPVNSAGTIEGNFGPLGKVSVKLR